jgi:FdhD protein
MESERPPTSATVATTVVALEDGAARAGERALAVEAPVNVVYGEVPYAVMMLTPADLEDFAYGFSLTEGVARTPDDLRGVEVVAAEDGLLLNVRLSPDRMHAHLARRRAMSGRTGCGVCGIEDLAAVPRAGRDAVVAPPLAAAALRRALLELEDNQPLNAEVRAVHAAGWADREGRLVLAREDVGRHNALDKAIGALVRAGTDPASGFLVITSRCSFEMAEKAVAFGAPALVAISAPTSLALERARRHGLTLVAVARRDTVTVFSGALAETAAG